MSVYPVQLRVLQPKDYGSDQGWGWVIGVVFNFDRLCYHVRYGAGNTDYLPISDERWIYEFRAVPID